MASILIEKPIIDLEEKIANLKRAAVSKLKNFDGEIRDLEQKANSLRREIFSRLTPYEQTQLARHPDRPNTLEMIGRMATEFLELHGDRNFLDDLAIVGGLARIGAYSVMMIGHQKGRGTKENIQRNFGMPKPEGYRKALRLMSLAERMHLPIITLVDTPGAFPGVDAEQRGQSEAIAKNIFVMNRLRTPIISIVIGEGGSGGALAIAVANRLHMLKYATYSVISPEGCASILMKDSRFADQAALALKLTATDLLGLKLIDSIIDEPVGGAHRDPEQVAGAIKKVILNDLDELTQVDPDVLKNQRVERYLAAGSHFET